ncbi:hypothetical protein GW17_00006398 [Ensete ventricosum]|nr:hypothetical protein GW17_00006398 [Ensete ventricosum]
MLMLTFTEVDCRRLRLKSFYDCYLATHRMETAFLKLTGKKVFPEEAAPPLLRTPRPTQVRLRPVPPSQRWPPSVVAQLSDG